MTWDERGVELVETAVVILILLMLILGVADLEERGRQQAQGGGMLWTLIQQLLDLDDGHLEGTRVEQALDVVEAHRGPESRVQLPGVYGVVTHEKILSA